MAEVILASCDSEYNKKYRKRFVSSAEKLGQSVYIINCEENPWNDISYYACARYLHLPEIIEEYGDVFVADIDMVFFKPVPDIHTKVGFVKTSPKSHRTAWEQRGMNLMAGFFYCSDVDIAVRIREKIKELPKKWFIDQVAIYEVIKDEKSRTYFNKPPTKPKNITEKDFALVPRGIGKDILEGNFVKSLGL